MMMMPRRLPGRIAEILDHPYWGSGALIAKTAVSAASIIWGVLALIQNDPLEPAEFPFYMSLVWLMPADHWAFGAIIIGAMAQWRLMTKQPPVPWGALGYFAMLVFWAYLAVSNFTVGLSIRPARTASVCVIGMLALYAFLTNPRKHGSPER